MAEAPLPPDRPPEPAGQPRRWLKVLLVVSLGLNLAVAGIVIGAALDHRRADIRPEPAALARDLGLGPYARALPHEMQRELGRSVLALSRQGGEGRRPLRMELRQGFRGMLSELRSEAFDAERAAALLAQQSGALEARRRLGQEALVDLLAGMSLEDRIAYADRLEQALRRPHRRD